MSHQFVSVHHTPQTTYSTCNHPLCQAVSITNTEHNTTLLGVGRKLIEGVRDVVIPPEDEKQTAWLYSCPLTMTTHTPQEWKTAMFTGDTSIMRVVQINAVPPNLKHKQA